MLDDFGALTQSLDIAGAPGGALAGKSFVVKENIDVAGCVTMNGNPEWAASHAPAALHAPVVDRLLAAGARLTGKAHMDEMAYSLLGANVHYGTPCNPAAPGRHPGGSSSGSAVAVAAGLADFALGSDTAGSCRAPAAFCGVFGFRPSHGAISSNGVIPLAQSLDTVGWFARDMETMIAVGEALLPEDLDRGGFAQALPLREAFDDAEAGFTEAAAPALAALAGARRPRDCRFGDAFWPLTLGHFRNLQAYEGWQAQGGWISSAKPTLGPGVKERFDYAAGVTAEQKQAADDYRREVCAKLRDIMGADGFLVAPTTPFRAPLLDESAEALDVKRYQMMRIFLIASFCGLPQLSLPLKSPGAPFGLSIIGRRWSDRHLLDFAQSLRF